ncbi:Nuclear inhibitor of phosphatase-1 [Plasmopara halstedii]|uniref:Nuclear inhibitor of phosphatase-1 n=1 Tax=Plasmopara halstedii TaxID=4781 RepID=A0A0P1AYB5_PLAHL|nr:Nuclear inhibitor of phosphatase-1 [Plasmopara halstedii]CEG47065.1 Nuclear inhibitor of phosphatase-1 [Plasmopara halstedii]|eukprot:XP_024583434.1 Nuclear inhibitor of phosphatase-1 [Plasmopara halstedii]
MEQALQLPRLLHLDTFVSQPKFLDPIDPPTVPFPPPTWCMHEPPRTISLLDVYKDHVLIATHTVDQKAFYLVGRNAAVCDIVLSHCSISRLHATIVHHEKGATYLVDLGSAHGTFVDGLRLTALQPTLVLHGSVLKFGGSSRSYTFKTFDSREQIAKIISNRVGLPPDELQLQQNTMLNSQITHRLELSPTLRNMPPMFPMAPVSQISSQAPDQDAPMLMAPDCDHSESVDGVQLLGLAGFGSVKKRSRGQSGNSQASGSSDQSGSTADLSVCLDDPADEQQGESKRVHFSGQPPEIIPDNGAASEEPIDYKSGAARNQEIQWTELGTSD